MDDVDEPINGSSNGSSGSRPAEGELEHGAISLVATLEGAHRNGSKPARRSAKPRGLAVTASAALAMIRPLLDRSAAGWFVYAGDGRLLYANAAVEHIIHTKVTIGSTALVPPVVPERRLAYQRVIQRLRSGSTTGAIVATLPVIVDGECRLVCTSLLAAPDTGGFGHAVIGMLQDVTVRDEVGRDAALERLGHLEQVLARIASDLAGVAPSYEQRPPVVRGLSPRQGEILQRLATGERPAAIARALHLSVHTVRNHTKAIFRVFGVHSQSELLVRIRDQLRHDS
jgi:DNA-binding CsgD family transcriptional regulator